MNYAFSNTRAIILIDKNIMERIDNEATKKVLLEIYGKLRAGQMSSFIKILYPVMALAFCFLSKILYCLV